MTKNQHEITIGWLYPELMSTYGDRGNIIILQKRAEWRNIKVTVKRISLDTKPEVLKTIELLFMGGAQDTQQEIVNKDLFGNKGKILQERIEEGTPGLFICGAYQFLGQYYKTADGKKLPGLGIFPVYTENPGEQVPRLIGNIVLETTLITSDLVGFENHGGRTYIVNSLMALGTVKKGFGNNGHDHTEGIIYKNSVGSYLHGPVLPKNPRLADWFITKALEKKYDKKINLEELDDDLEKKAKELIVNRLRT